MLDFNMETSINNINYLRYMEEQEKKAANDNGKQNPIWSGNRPPQSENREKRD